MSPRIQVFSVPVLPVENPGYQHGGDRIPAGVDEGTPGVKELGHHQKHRQGRGGETEGGNHHGFHGRAAAGNGGHRHGTGHRNHQSKGKVPDAVQRVAKQGAAKDDLIDGGDTGPVHVAGSAHRHHHGADLPGNAQFVAGIQLQGQGRSGGAGAQGCQGRGEDVFEVVEEVIYNVFKEFSSKEVDSYPFERISYKESMLKYGSDKPDLRNPLVIKDVTEVFSKIEFNAFKGKTVRTIVLPNANEISRKFFDAMSEFATSPDCGAKGLAWIKVNESEELQGSIAKFITDEAKRELLEKTGAIVGNALLFVADEETVVSGIAGKIRTEAGVRLNLIDKNKFKFCWIVDFPMYELDDEGNVAFSHNPFSMPQGGLEALDTKNPLEINAYQYDLVCNGVELSSGAVRNHNPEIMVKAFEIAGYEKDVIFNKFPALFNAFHYGAPPHAGIAPGVDRMIMLIADEPNIREVIAFPMNSKAQDLLMGAPGTVTEKQLKEIHIKIDVKEKQKEE